MRDGDYFDELPRAEELADALEEAAVEETPLHPALSIMV
jgi:hypothetical protein